ncbi:PASTA domain-containing protein [Nocardia sp. AB354]|uniref:PASTA domain-containing protein n=1 Tax=Nocardia sp. AB354 TaxID=3413283 RepID=UPI003C20E087
MKRDTRILLGLGIVCALLIVVAGLTYSAIKPHRSADAVMPDLRGVSLTDARKRLADLELKAQTVDDTGNGRHVMFDSNWTVTSQTPSAGATLADLKKITLGVVKKGEAPRAATSGTPSPTTNSSVKTSTTGGSPGCMYVVFGELRTPSAPRGGQLVVERVRQMGARQERQTLATRPR